MKKGRLATKVCALVDGECEDQVRTALFEETGTLGVRRTDASRVEVERHLVEVETAYGCVRVKQWARGAAPEYEDCARLARAAGVPLARVMVAAREATRSLAATDSIAVDE